MGHIIGKAGATIKQLSEDSGTQISINQPEIELGPESLRIITVSGAAVGLCAAQKLLTEKLQAIGKSLKTSDGAPVLAGIAVPAGAVPAGGMGGMMVPPMGGMMGGGMGMLVEMTSTAALYGSGAFPILGGRGERNIVLVLETMIGAWTAQQTLWLALYVVCMRGVWMPSSGLLSVRMCVTVATSCVCR